MQERSPLSGVRGSHPTNQLLHLIGSSNFVVAYV